MSPRETGTAKVNGLSLYFEVHGEGAPLMMLHGGLGGIFMFDAILPILAAKREVIAVELQGHGHTALTDRPMTYENMADDIAALIDARGLKRADVMGYSLGGGTALQTAIRHPDKVRKGVIVSVPFKHTAWYPEVREGMAQMGPERAEMMKASHLYQAYEKSAPHVGDWSKLVTAVGALVCREYDWSKEIAALRMPLLVASGDADSFPPSHVAEFYARLGGGKVDAGWDGAARIASQLAVVPGATHYNIAEKPVLAELVLSFLDD
jgi:pimeloyl-ACP methyl ester carboxylesterase